MIFCGLVNIEPAVVTKSNYFDRGFSNLALVLDIANYHKKISVTPAKYLLLFSQCRGGNV